MAAASEEGVASDSSVCLSITDLIEESIGEMVDSHDSLQDSIIKYEFVVDQLEKLWESKVCFSVSVNHLSVIVNFLNFVRFKSEK